MARRRRGGDVTWAQGRGGHSCSSSSLSSYSQLRRKLPSLLLFWFWLGYFLLDCFSTGMVIGTRCPRSCSDLEFTFCLGGWFLGFSSMSRKEWLHRFELWFRNPLLGFFVLVIQSWKLDIWIKVIQINITISTDFDIISNNLGPNWDRFQQEDPLDSSTNMRTIWGFKPYLYIFTTLSSLHSSVFPLWPQVHFVLLLLLHDSFGFICIQFSGRVLTVIPLGGGSSLTSSICVSFKFLSLFMWHFTVRKQTDRMLKSNL